MVLNLYNLKRKNKMMMIKDDTLKEMNNIPHGWRNQSLNYLVKNCSSYVVTPEGHEHWLFRSVILTHWGTDTGYTRKYLGLAFPDNFESWTFDNNKIASEAFKTHHEMENA
jgi:hypothetical protein